MGKDARDEEIRLEQERRLHDISGFTAFTGFTDI